MNKQNIMSAEFIKSQLIDFLMIDFSDKTIIGNEVMYGSKRKLVDLLILKNNTLTAIEIKAGNDDLRRITEQVEEYRKIFDYIIICTVAVHLGKIISLLSDDIGIYCINEQNIEVVRKPKKQGKLDKSEMLFTINSNFLKKNLSPKINFENSDEVRKHYVKESRKKIHNTLVDYLYEKIEPKFNLFLEHRGVHTLIDDISLLSSSYIIR
jgi:hypothetical protein